VLIKTKGIIFRNLKYGESSLIQDIYTETHGLKSYIISGVRNKKKGNKSGLLQVMGLVDLVAYNKESKSLNRIKEVKADYLYRNIPFDVVRSSIGMFIIELSRRSITENEQNDSLFQFLRNSYLYLDQCQGSMALLPIIFLIKLSKELGFAPSQNYSESEPLFDLMEGAFTSGQSHSNYLLSKDGSQHFYSLLFEDYGISNSYSVPKHMRLYLLDQLIIFFRLHIDNLGEIKSLGIIKELFD